MQQTTFSDADFLGALRVKYNLSAQDEQVTQFFSFSNRHIPGMVITNVCALSTLNSVYFDCLRFYGPVNPMGSYQACSVYLPHFHRAGLVLLAVNQYYAHSFPDTDNCPSWISGRERMTAENISWSISTKECCWHSGGRIHTWSPVRYAIQYITATWYPF